MINNFRDVKVITIKPLYLQNDLIDKYNKLQFLSKHFISLFLSWQNIRKIKQRYSFTQLVSYIKLESTQSITEIQELKNIFIALGVQLQNSLLFNNIKQQYEKFFQGMIQGEKKQLLQAVKKYQVSENQLGNPGLDPVQVIFKMKVQFDNTTLIPEIPILEQSSRLTRQFGSRNFIRVSFEQKSRPYQIKQFLISGFLFAGRYWVYFGQGSGQLNDKDSKSCWFCAFPDKDLSQFKIFFQKHLEFITLPNYYQSIDVVDLNQLKQLKANSSYFRQICISWLGDFQDIQLVCKLSTRHGLCLGKSFPTLNVIDEQINLIYVDDYETDRGNFSDGCGEISHDIMTLIQNSYQNFIQKQKEKSITAIQFRFRGCKGILQVNPFLPERTMLLNQSQKKFNIENPTDYQNRIEIVNIVQQSQGFLNEQIIVLLSSLGIQNDFFIKVLDYSLNNFVDLLQSKFKICKMIVQQRYTQIGDLCLKMILSGVSIDDFVFSSSIKEIQEQQLTRIQQKYRLILPQSRFLYGVYDIFHILGENEVFIASEDVDFQQLSEVVIAKNPCTHPGNIRKVRVINLYERFIEKYQIKDEKLLNLIKNTYSGVVVFPVCSSKTRHQQTKEVYSVQFQQLTQNFRPIPDSLGGSDLDGDIYFVTWDLDIINNIKIVEPQQVFLKDNEQMEKLFIKNHRLDSQNQNLNTYYNQISSVIDWLSNRFCDFSLGIIGKTHSLAGDLFGFNNPLTIELSRCFNLAVDQDKNGWIMTDQTKRLIESVSKIQLSEIVINLDHKCENYQLESAFDANSKYVSIVPHYLINRQVINKGKVFVFHSISILGKMFDHIEKFKIQELYQLNEQIYSNQSFLQQKEFYFSGIAKRINIQQYNPINSLATIGITEKDFEIQYILIQKLVMQFVDDMTNNMQQQQQLLISYYQDILFLGQTLTCQITRALWFYFLVYEECKKQNYYDETYETFDEDTLFQDEYFDKIQITNLNITSDDQNCVIYEKAQDQSVKSIQANQVYDMFYQTKIENFQTDHLQQLSYLSIILPSQIVTDSRLVVYKNYFDHKILKQNRINLHQKQNLSKLKQQLSRIFQSEEVVEEKFEQEEQPEEYSEVEEIQLKLFNGEIKLYESILEVPKCQFHDGFKLQILNKQQETLVQQFQKTKQFTMARTAWFICSKPLCFVLSKGELCVAKDQIKLISIFSKLNEDK